MYKITLDMLTEHGVSVKKQKYVSVDGQEYLTGQPWRRAYVNSVRGRQQIEDELPQPYLSAVLALWGDEPTVNDELQE